MSELVFPTESNVQMSGPGVVLREDAGSGRSRLGTFAELLDLIGAASEADLAAYYTADQVDTLLGGYLPYTGASASLDMGGFGVTAASATVNGRVVVTPAAISNSPASTEYTDLDFNLARNVQFAAGAITSQRAVRFRSPTYAFTSSSTITTAATVRIDDPTAGTNATIRNPLALWAGASLFGGGVFVGDPGFVKGAWLPLSGTISRLLVGSDGVSGGIELYAGGGATGSYSSATRGDVYYYRNATGPKASIRAAGGLEVRNLDGSADAPITCAALTASAKSSFPLGFQVGSFGHFRSDGTYGMIQSYSNGGNGTATAATSFLPTVASGFSLGEVGYTGWTYLLLQSGSGSAVIRPAASNTVEVRNSTNTAAGNISAGAATFSGNVGIGTTPSAPLHISGTGAVTTGNLLRIVNTADFTSSAESAVYIRFGITGGGIGKGISVVSPGGTELFSVGAYGINCQSFYSDASQLVVGNNKVLNLMEGFGSIQKSGSNIQFATSGNLNLVPTGGTVAVTGTGTFTKANGAAVLALGGGSRTHIGIGRTSEEANFGIAGSAGQYASGSSVGDLCITSGGTLHVANYTTGAYSNLRSSTVQVGTQAAHSLTIGAGTGSSIIGYYAGTERSSIVLNTGGGSDIFLATSGYIWLGTATTGNSTVQIGPTSFNTTVRTHTLKAAGRSSFGAYTGAGHHLKIAAGEADGTNLAGGNLTLYGGQGTGTGAGGSVVIQTALAGSSGSSLNSLVDRLTIDSTGLFTFADACNMAFNGTTGTKIGTGVDQKIGIWNATPIVQPAHANQAALSLDVDVTGVDTVDKTAIDANFTAIQTLVNQLRSDLVSVGLIKGAA